MLANWWYGKAMLEQYTIKSLDEWSDEMEIVGHICDFFDYLWLKYDDGRIVLDSRGLYGDEINGTDSIYGNCEWLGKDYCGHIEASSVQEMCLKFLDSFKNCEKQWVDYYSEDIAFIESLIK